MKFYLAPMEGITGYIYRNAYEAFFTPADKYFTPFIAANPEGRFSSREKADLDKEHNTGKTVIPQILTNHVQDFVAISRSLQALGYEEVNLNLGCPSGTVVSKNRGSGFLSQPEALNQFLEAIFNELSDMKISIKTRIGKESPDEFPRLMAIYEQYPITELIIHPRIQKDFYKNTPRLEVFQEVLGTSKLPIVYNGDVFTTKDYEKVVAACPNLECVMLGRGLIANPGLLAELTGSKSMTKSQLKGFHDALFEGYAAILSGERNVLFKMKELWFYMGYMFAHADKDLKKIKKAQHFSDYLAATDHLFAEQELVKNGGLFIKPISSE